MIQRVSARASSPIGSLSRGSKGPRSCASSGREIACADWTDGRSRRLGEAQRHGGPDDNVGLSRRPAGWHKALTGPGWPQSEPRDSHDSASLWRGFSFARLCSTEPRGRVGYWSPPIDQVGLMRIVHQSNSLSEVRDPFVES